MVLFPNCKINIGLDVLARRADGFHELSSLMYPIKGLCDSLEIVRTKGDVVEFATSGLTVDCHADNNICVKAYRLLREKYGISGVRMHLHKAIPFGAGLGGGSSDAAFAIRGLNSLFELGLDTKTMESLAARLGSDTAFFIANQPAMASGRGEILESSTVNLKGLHLVILKPTFSIGTAEAYSEITPQTPTTTLKDRLSKDISQWHKTINNDFERHIFQLHPQLSQLKTLLYKGGAAYASMSGSGSAIYGIFEQRPILPKLSSDMFVYQGVMP